MRKKSSPFGSFAVSLFGSPELQLVYVMASPEIQLQFPSLAASVPPVQMER